MRAFYEPTREQLGRLAGPWCASHSGGKDSSSLVVWLEWLRRAGWLTAPRPRLVRSDTGVEEGGLVGLAEELTAALTRSGWECAVVRPEPHERLYCQILGRGLPPVHAGIRRMRWCTRSTKIDPMERWKGDGLTLTGLRLGESAMRDGKLLKSSCAAGGECGIPDPGEGKYSPLLHWKTCHVIDWLSGAVAEPVRRAVGDLFAVTARLVELYGVTTATDLFGEREAVSAARFGCVGCPAISAEDHAPRSVLRRNGAGSPLNELYDVWFEARKAGNRLVNRRTGKAGPVRMGARKRLFERVMDIQRRAGVVLVTAEDEAFIRRCWAGQVYPRGWGPEDEATGLPCGPLFEGSGY